MSTDEHDPVGAAPVAPDPGADGAGARRWLLLTLAAVGLLVLGALGGIAISDAVDDDDSSAAAASPRVVVARAAVDVTSVPETTETSATGPTETTDTAETTATTETTDTAPDTTDTTTTTETTDSGGTGTITEPPPALIALADRIPAGDQPCGFIQPSEGAWVIRCQPADGVVSLYRKFDSTAELRADYAAFLEESGISEGQTPSPCPNTVPSDQAVTRAELTVGRLQCYEFEGQQWIVWTSEPLNAMGLASGPKDMSAAALYEWWQTTQRPVLTDAELGFYARVPENHRADCDFRYVSYSEVQAVPPPENGSTALCYLPVSSGSNEVVYQTVVYTQHFNAEKMAAAYAKTKALWGVTDNTGDCTTAPPGEDIWNQDGKDAGRFACTTYEDLPVMAWTTDAVNIISFSIAATGQTLAQLWDWWTTESGPLYRSG